MANPLVPTDLEVDTASKPAIPKRIEPRKHGGSQPTRFSQVSSALTLLVGTPVAYNEATKGWQSWDPVTGVDVAVNEVQEMNMDAGVDGGNFVLSFGGEVTTPLAHSASASTVETALEVLSTIAVGDLTVSGGAMPGTPMLFTFTGNLAGAPQAMLGLDDAELEDGGVLDAGAAMTRVTAGSGGGALNAVQTLDDGGTASGGTFTLTYDGQTTAAIDYDETASNVEAALDLLSNVVTAAISVSGGTLPSTPMVFTFDGASVAASDQPLLVADGALLTGSSPAYAVVETVQGSRGSGAPAGDIKGFVYPTDVVLSEDGDVYGVTMRKGAIHRADVELPTTGSPTEDQLDDALRTLLTDQDILVQGLSDVR